MMRQSVGILRDFKVFRLYRRRNPRQGPAVAFYWVYFGPGMVRKLCFANPPEDKGGRAPSPRRGKK